MRKHNRWLNYSITNLGRFQNLSLCQQSDVGYGGIGALMGTGGGTAGGRGGIGGALWKAGGGGGRGAPYAGGCIGGGGGPLIPGGTGGPERVNGGVM